MTKPNEFEFANRLIKATKLVTLFRDCLKKSAFEISQLDDSGWAAAAGLAHTTNPSSQTRQMVVEMMQTAEAAASSFKDLEPSDG